MDIGYLRMMPNVVLTAPANEVEMKLALEFALKANKCVCLRYPKDAVPSEDFDACGCAEPFELGKSVIVKKVTNSSIALVSYGSILEEVLEASEILGEEGVEVSVINARFAAPIDKSIISLLETNIGLITIEDHRLACGFGSGVLEAAARAYPAGIKRPILTLGMEKEFIKHDSRKSQLQMCGINADKIAQTARKMLSLAK